MKTCHLSSVHPRGDTRIFHKECKSLARAGYDVSLIVKSEKDEVLDGVKIIAIREENGRLGRMTRAVRAVYQKALERDADIYHFHDPELIPVGILLRLRGKKVIYDVHEDVPRQILSKPWIAPWLRYPVACGSALAEWVGSRFFFSRVVAATPLIAQRFPKRKTKTVQNFPILKELVRPNPTGYSQRPENVVYIGGISRIRGALEHIKAFESVRSKNCRFVMAGSFESGELEEECKALKGWARVDFKGWLDRRQVAELLDGARVGLVALHPVPNHIRAYPVKLFEYMSAGIPVIASDFPLWREIVEGANCGLLVDPMKPLEIAKAIDWLLDNPKKAEEMGENGKRAVLKKYNWQREEAKLLELYQRIAGQ